VRRVLARYRLNLADKGDLVAIPVDGVSDRFTGVDIDRRDIVGTFDFHSARGYLGCGELTSNLAVP
jgi:hypothetical protein